MKTLLLGLLICFLSITGWARLGETGQQMTARYGRPVEFAKAPQGRNIVEYPSGDYRIVATYVKGYVHSLTYYKVIPSNTPFTDREISILLGLDESDSTWKRIPSTDFNVMEWTRSDGMARATYLPNDVPPSLTINSTVAQH